SLPRSSFFPLLFGRNPAGRERRVWCRHGAWRRAMDPMEGLKAAMAAVDAYYSERGIFQERFGFGESPALVIIDMAYGWTDPAYAGGSARLGPALDAIRQLLPVARQKGVPVIYTTSPYQDKPQFKSAADFSPNFRKWDRRACEI